MGSVPDATPRRVLAVANQKGGVGKTTTAVNVAAALAELDRRVLVVDLDPQGNATTGLGVVKEGLHPTIYHVLLGHETAEAALHSTEIAGLSIVPSSIDLVGAEIELVTAERREYVVSDALKILRDKVDYIVVDCPPSLGLLTLNALTAADRVLVPLQCEFYALEGLAHLIKTISRVRERLNPALRVSGIVLTMFDGRTSLALQIRDEVNRYFPGQVLETVIPRNIRVTEAPSHGKPIMLYDLKSSGSIAYLELTREVIHGS